MLTGCQKNESGSAEPTATPEPTEEVTPEPTAMAAEEPEPTEDPIPDGYVVSYLTGEYVPEAIGRRRPVAVMLNNLRPACPQAGIANAGVVYEAPVEGGITRLMGIFEDYDNLEKIGSVRSCRDYYIFYASGFDAIYTHYGQSAYALPFLELSEVNNISGLAGYGDQVFYRTTENGYLNIDVDEPNVGKYIVNGKAIDITWKKHTPWGATFYYDTNGNQITMDTGKTWVCIIQDTYADRVEILGSNDSSASSTDTQDSEAQAAAEEAAASDTEY